MATVRPPLNSRMPVHVSSLPSPQKYPRATSGTKRGRSPEPPNEANTQHSGFKRPRPVPASPALAHTVRDDASKDRERKRAERDAQKQEFRIKYTRAFPSWTFYFDLDQHDAESAAVRQVLEARVLHVGGRIEDFFSSEVSHLITNKPLPPEEPPAEKENLARARTKSGALLKSPIKLRGRAAEEPPTQSNYDNLVAKAVQFNMKIWSAAKLDSVLDRCDVPVPAVASTSTSRTAPNPQTLGRLLQSERMHGTTERDPRERRHDYRYFSRGSCFVLVEDIKGELATVAALEYPVNKPSERPTWPVLYCHPNARGPFIEYDEKEKRRYERSLLADTEKEEAERRRSQRIREEEKRKLMLKKQQQGDLRRTASHNNLRRSSHGGPGPYVDFDDVNDNQESANASGYLASGAGYMAASGNSVGITSTTGTTSAAGSRRNSAQLEHLPANLRNTKMFTTTRRASAVADKVQGKQKIGTMGPPIGIPERIPNLRKAKSMNTMKLEKREEGKKPGYCESCRQKFEDFKVHIVGRKHRKFAMNDDNFLQLDYTLGRVERRTKVQVAEEERMRIEMRERRAQYGSDADYEEEVHVKEEDRSSLAPVLFSTSEDGRRTMVAADTEIGQPDEEL